MVVISPSQSSRLFLVISPFNVHFECNYGKSDRKQPMKTLILSFVLGLSATAEPAWFDEINIPQKGPLKQISPTKLEYVISFNGKGKAGTLKILFGEKRQAIQTISLSEHMAEAPDGPKRSFPTSFIISAS